MELKIEQPHPELGVRAARTMTRLTNALMSLLVSQGVDGLSVSKLCREAGVHRTTFYGHYSSVEQFAVDILTHLVDKFAEVDIPDDLPFDEVADFNYQIIYQMLQFLKESRPAYRALLSSSIGFAFRVALRSSMEERCQLAVDTWKHVGVGWGTDDEIVVNYLAGGLTASFEKWVFDDDDDVELRTQTLMNLIPPTYSSIHQPK